MRQNENDEITDSEMFIFFIGFFLGFICMFVVSILLSTPFGLIITVGVVGYFITERCFEKTKNPLRKFWEKNVWDKVKNKSSETRWKWAQA